jgi:hypothetical protein
MTAKNQGDPFSAYSFVGCADDSYLTDPTSIWPHARSGATAIGSRKFLAFHRAPDGRWRAPAELRKALNALVLDLRPGHLPYGQCAATSDHRGAEAGAIKVMFGRGGLGISSSV